MWPAPEPNRKTSLSDPETYLGLLKPDRCPICFLVQGYVHEHLKSLLDESITDPSTRKALTESHGFCHRHAWKAVQQRQALPLAVLSQDLLEKGIQILSRKSFFRKNQKPKPCPLCLSEKNREKAAIQDFVRCLAGSPILQSAFKDHGILCLPHLTRALKVPQKSENRKSLGEIGQKALEGLAKI